ncbi:MAG: L-asparaginase 1 [Bacteroidetes bacterium]|nr:MAG: L-asparaginase 1 [Bacteroidota bacterium]
MDQKTPILVIYTGGTIGMIQDQQTGALRPFNFDRIYTQMPELREMEYLIDCHSFDPLIDSSDMNPSFWVQLAEVIETNYESYDGFVILHGSDTMAYSASMMSFMLENLNKPVVFTGSQLPLGVLRSDGRENFITAIEIAAATIDDTPIVPEVSIYFENKLYRGNRTHKFNAEHFEAFLSVNYPVLAEAGVHIKYHYERILKPNFKKLKVHKKLNNNVAVLKLFPGIKESIVEAVINTEGLEAIVLETFGSGNAPTERWFIEQLKSAREKGIIVFNVTQCKGGSVEIGKYAASLDMGKIGIIGGYDITTEAALTKVMYLLGRDAPKEETEKLLQKPLRGEMTL